MNQDGFVRFGILRANDFAGLRIAQVNVAIDEVRDDMDRAGGREGFNGLAPQIIGDGGDAVAFVDGVAGDRQIGAIGAYQGDVGPVQRGHKGKPATVARQHLPGQHGADRMGNRIVNVQQIEVVIFRDLRHARRQGQRVRRKFKQRIVRDRDLVKMNSLFATAESKRLRVRDEMNVVAAIGQLDSQLRGDYATAAIRRITGDADFHMRSLSASIDAGR